MKTLSRREILAAASALSLVPTIAVAASSGWRKLVTEPIKGKQDDISFVDPLTGWYGNGAGKLYATRDGGETWTKMWETPGTFIRSVGFMDAQNGFVGNVGTDYYPNVSDTTLLYRTRDGGKTFQPVALPAGATIRGICGIDILKTKSILQGELEDRIFVHAAGRVGGPAAILRSLDAGETWSHLDLSAQAGMILDVKFFDPMTGLVAASTSADIAQGQALILNTQDGGRTWIESYRGARKFENVWKMSFPTRDVGYGTVQSYDDTLAEGQQRIVKTTDGGKSWTELPLVKDVKQRQFGLGFATPDLGWVGCRAGGYETRDGGKSWSPASFGPAVNKIRVVPKDAGFVAYAIGVEVHKLSV
jgi:photosystem II stability/assembly factor-like uncharacterized protein